MSLFRKIGKTIRFLNIIAYGNKVAKLNKISKKKKKVINVNHRIMKGNIVDICFAIILMIFSSIYLYDEITYEHATATVVGIEEHYTTHSGRGGFYQNHTRANVEFYSPEKQAMIPFSPETKLDGFLDKGDKVKIEWNPKDLYSIRKQSIMRDIVWTGVLGWSIFLLVFPMDYILNKNVFLNIGKDDDKKPATYVRYPSKDKNN
ncbi:hypothetical protein FC70_GL000906 [Paucilactobacillus oligofermentans DSM 15707 = LMG 22743]|uniref:DUF3592 domain-containing protein n=1 Tax=Paucilactobacillus oligofermentans DSM 15707 = LMG 22743 TaxID=1423778 RepID=A0A0R1RG22_9LACO|nr:hypothetical protein [Paucilactobacillus oligofermentans]KRL55310.1 hypothetical protein FC70_GL000906 [Paucilactobacillus oligofermentans DSM 15707 = LMG 22743]CUS25699.1 Uncharacterized protein LACOL_0391 [Paucilactobacillus oligofermentans DSM 15707 = LMG 22743]